MKKRIWMILPLLICMSSPAYADFYKYKDADGHTRYTDDLSKVPKDQRPDVQSYVESRTSEAATPVAETRGTDAKPEKNQGQGKGIGITELRRQLNQNQHELDQEHDALMKEKAELAKLKTNIKSGEDIKTYNRRIAAFNEKIEAYEAKRKDHNAQLDSYNAKVADAVNPKK